MGSIWPPVPSMTTSRRSSSLSTLSITINVSIFFMYVSQMPKGQTSHPHRMRQVTKSRKSKLRSSDSKVPESSQRPEWLEGPGEAKSSRGEKSTRTSSLSMEEFADLLGEPLDRDIDIQEAFGSLLNAQDVLGVSCDPVVDNDDGEQALRRSLQKLHHPTQSSSGSLVEATLPHDAYSLNLLLWVPQSNCALRFAYLKAYLSPLRFFWHPVVVNPSINI